MKTQAHHRGAFTLVELLTVIAIIGVLVGLIVPAVGFALRKVKENAIAMEVMTLSNAFSGYEQEFNDLPPDGTSSTIVSRHLLKLFPQMASSELRLLTTDTFPGTSTLLVNNASVAPGMESPAGVMDPAEAVVFFLGGFSDDPQYPLSGVGGPFFILGQNGQVTSATPAAQRVSVQYNTERTNPLYEFDSGQLTLAQGNLTLSNDEEEILGNPNANDCLPAYRPRGNSAPYVYFDSRTYSVSVPGGLFFSHYTTSQFGVARPYRSSQRNTRTAATPANADSYYEYMNPGTFQFVSAGLDDSFGGIPFTSGGGPVFYEFASGQSIDFGGYPGNAPVEGGYSRYQDDSGLSTQLDNVTNFSEGVLGDALEN
ncbi:MAG: prepilin-type N-terminal cleavage/methylation domain-containing protein [Aureliella sp.]